MQIDFVVVDLTRGRDHGVAGYTKFHKHCFGKALNSFDDLKGLMSIENADLLIKTYKSVHDIELYVGGQAETHVKGAIMGPTLACLFGQQFHNLKFGDRYYFEHGEQAGSFNTAQLASIRKMSLAAVFCKTAKD